jgi:uncharacterized membrane protein YedE/YeeE
MENFTPIASLLGGILIGLSASAMLLFNGKIAGISGILGGLVGFKKKDTLWRASFVAGLITGGLVLRALAPQVFDFAIVRSAGALAVAGFMVGLGARVGNGCTSGHGVCGISRFSVRSMVATMLFIVAGAATVFLVNHLLGGMI